MTNHYAGFKLEAPGQEEFTIIQVHISVCFYLCVINQPFFVMMHLKNF